MYSRVRIKTKYLELHVRHLLSGFSAAVSTLTQPAAAQVYSISTQASKNQIAHRIHACFTFVSWPSTTIEL
jgi:hypothetical protein